MTTTHTPLLAGVPVVDTNPYDEDVLRDPYEFYEELREAGPVAWLSSLGVYATGRFDEAREILNNNTAFLSGRGVGVEDVEARGSFRPPSIILEADGAAHAHVRKEMMGILSSGFVRSIRPEWTEQIEAIVDEAVAKGEFDLIGDIAYRIPLEVLADEVGFQSDRRYDLIAYGNNVFNANGPSSTRLQQESLEEGPHYQKWVEELCKRENIAPGGIGAKLWALTDSGDLSPREAGLLVRTFYAAGVDSSATAIGNALRELVSAPTEWAKLHENPRLAKLAGEECIRLTSVVQMFFRHVVSKTEISGTVLPAGSRIGVWMAAANRDPRKWGNDADQLNVSRPTSGQLAFGGGAHICAGMGLARLQMDAVITALTKRVKKIELVSEPELRLNNFVRSWSSVPVRVVELA